MSNNNTVKILLSGHAAKVVNIESGESLADFRDRMSSGDLPMHKIETLYLNGKPVSNPAAHTLTSGDVIAGAPKLEGGSC